MTRNSLADDPHPFYGYCTLHSTRKGWIQGMLSVNGYVRTVWYPPLARHLHRAPGVKRYGHEDA